MWLPKWTPRKFLAELTVCLKWELFPSLPFFLHRLFEFDDLDTELVKAFRLKIAMLLFLFIAIRSVELQYKWLIYY